MDFSFTHHYNLFYYLIYPWSFSTLIVCIFIGRAKLFLSNTQLSKFSQRGKDKEMQKTSLSQTKTKEKRLRNVLKNWGLFAFVWIYSNVWEIFLVRKLTGGKIMPNCFAEHEIGINIQGHKRDNWSRFLPIFCWHISDNICFVNGNNWWIRHVNCRNKMSI